MKTAGRIAPVLSRSAFWDVDRGTLDFERYATFIIIRVMERGSKKDIEAIIDYYGSQLIIDTLTKASSLMLRGIAAGKHYFNLNDTDFICFTKTPSHRNLSMF